MQPNYQSGPGTQSPQPQPDYSFIMNPEKPPRKPWLPGANSVVGRVVFVLAGLLVLLILFIVIRGVLSSNSNLPEFVSLAQTQQELIHVAANGTIRDEELPATLQNFAITTQLSLQSSQKEVTTYLANNGKKMNTKTLNQTVSLELDEQLDTSLEDSTYDSLFRKTMKEMLNDYQQQLERTYSHTKGPKGKALLDKTYQESQLLEHLLETPAF